MTKIKDKKAIATLAAGIALAAASLGCYALYQNEAQENDELKQQLERLAKNEKQSVVMQRVNAQMEEIANAERRISD
jgi:23S rRNA A2030 N6-methylase RlmJ